MPTCGAQCATTSLELRMQWWPADSSDSMTQVRMLIGHLHHYSGKIPNGVKTLVVQKKIKKIKL